MGKKEILEAQAERILEALARIDDRPSEPRPDEDGAAIVWFKKQFSHGQKAYTYCAVLAGGRWYLSGARPVCQGVTWDVLCDWIFAQSDEGKAPRPELWTVATWEALD